MTSIPYKGSVYGLVRYLTAVKDWQNKERFNNAFRSIEDEKVRNFELVEVFGTPFAIDFISQQDSSNKIVESYSNITIQRIMFYIDPNERLYAFFGIDANGGIYVEMNNELRIEITYCRIPGEYLKRQSENQNNIEIRDRINHFFDDGLRAYPQTIREEATKFGKNILDGFVEPIPANLSKDVVHALFHIKQKNTDNSDINMFTLLLYENVWNHTRMSQLYEMYEDQMKDGMIPIRSKKLDEFLEKYPTKFIEEEIGKIAMLHEQAKDVDYKFYLHRVYFSMLRYWHLLQDEPSDITKWFMSKPIERKLSRYAELVYSLSPEISRWFKERENT